MRKIRLTKISGDGLIPVISTKGNTKVKCVQGYPNGVYPEIPTVGYPFGVYDDDSSAFRTSPVREILSANTFRTENSIYRWKKL